MDREASSDAPGLERDEWHEESMIWRQPPSCAGTFSDSAGSDSRALMLPRTLERTGPSKGLPRNHSLLRHLVSKTGTYADVRRIQSSLSATWVYVSGSVSLSPG